MFSHKITMIHLMFVPLKRWQLVVAFSLIAIDLMAQTLCHPEIGQSVSTKDGQLKITLIAKKQNYDGGDAASRDKSIFSPKSVNIHPNGSKYYVNSLEGASTVVYEFPSSRKIKEIHHRFEAKKDSRLWSPSSPFYKFSHYKDQNISLNTFYGKPVESVFSHDGRYLWIPYYRRSYDINAQDPSAVAVIDTERDEIVRLMETGPLPKMIAVSPNGRLLAIAHWGDNTVGVIDISSKSPKDWRHKTCYVVDYKLNLNYSLTEHVDRDNGSGYALRGTVFTPDNRYLLVSCMGGGGGIAVIDLQSEKYLGRIMGMMSNVRHLVIDGGYLYLSINSAGYIQRIPLKRIIEAITTMHNKRVVVSGWENCKVGKGARTIKPSPSGKYIFAACNTSSALYIVDTRKMQTVVNIAADSYPVGLDVSKDGEYVFVTSQGHSKQGGNAVDIYKVVYK